MHGVNEIDPDATLLWERQREVARRRQPGDGLPSLLRVRGKSVLLRSSVLVALACVVQEGDALPTLAPGRSPLDRWGIIPLVRCAWTSTSAPRHVRRPRFAQPPRIYLHCVSPPSGVHRFLHDVVLIVSLDHRLNPGSAWRGDRE